MGNNISLIAAIQVFEGIAKNPAKNLQERFRTLWLIQHDRFRPDGTVRVILRRLRFPATGPSQAKDLAEPDFAPGLPNVALSARRCSSSIQAFAPLPASDRIAWRSRRASAVV